MAVDTLKYDELLKKTFATLNSYVESEWPVVKQTDRVTVSSTPSKDGIKIFKGVTEINATPKTTLEYIIPGPNRVRRQWDASIKELNIVETLHESSIVLQTVTKSAVWGLISSRDFVDLLKWEYIKESGVYYICGVGIDHPSCPETTNFVRGLNYDYGTFCFPTDNFKGVTEINATPKMTLEYIIPGPNRVRRQWDASIKEFNVVETLHESSIVLQTVTKSVAWGLISSRDFVDLLKWGHTEESGVYYICQCGVGIDHPSCPETPNFVRGVNCECGTFCFPTDNGQKSKVVYILQSDLRG